MWIVAIGWIYVVALMAATEPTVLAGIMTFFGYCVLPLSVVFYLTGSKRRRQRRETAARQASATTDNAASANIGGAGRTDD
jgi:cytochrome c biogenesis protein CcdA